MTTQRFRELVKKLMPRKHGEVCRQPAALRNVLRHREIQNRRESNRAARYNHCWCGIVTRGKFCSIHIPWRFKRIRVQTAIASALALIAFNASALQSPRDSSLQLNQTMTKSTTVTLRWLPSLSPEVDGYTLFGQTTINVGLATTTTVTMRYGTSATFYVVARAGALQSAPSNVVKVTVQRHGAISSS